MTKTIEIKKGDVIDTSSIGAFHVTFQAMIGVGIRCTEVEVDGDIYWLKVNGTIIMHLSRRRFDIKFDFEKGDTVFLDVVEKEVD